MSKDLSLAMMIPVATAMILLQLMTKPSSHIFFTVTIIILSTSLGSKVGHPRFLFNTYPNNVGIFRLRLFKRFYGLPYCWLSQFVFSSYRLCTMSQSISCNRAMKFGAVFFLSRSRKIVFDNKNQSKFSTNLAQNLRSGLNIIFVWKNIRLHILT